MNTNTNFGYYNKNTDEVSTRFWATGRRASADVPLAAIGCEDCSYLVTFLGFTSIA